MRVSAVAFPAGPVPRLRREMTGRGAFLRAAELARRAPALHLCVAVPAAGADEGTLALVRREMAALPATRGALVQADG